MSHKLTEPAEALVARSARAMTRRRLFRRAGTAALGASLVTAYVDRSLVDPAFAVSCFGRNEECGVQCKQGLCGPSPGCGSNHCLGNGQCVDDNRTRHRFYEGNTCEGSNIPNKQNCWCSCSPQGKMRRCCDCCQENDTGSSFRCLNTSCPGQSYWFACVCSTVICDNCC